MVEIVTLFEGIGGTFVRPAAELAATLADIECFVFDWDGVFNDGIKAADRGSGFSEADSMGLNMLRFGHWRMQQKMARVFIVTGENNPAAVAFAQREYLDAVYLGLSQKDHALNHISQTYGISPQQMAFVFDDVLDLSACRLCRMAICVRRQASPLFQRYVVAQRLCHYLSGHTGGAHAVREICELLLGLRGQYDETIRQRIEFTDTYRQYLQHRQAITPRLETRKTVED